MNEESFKKILKAELSKFATKQDFNNFATKEYLEKRLKQSEEMLHLDMQIIAGKIIEEMKQNSAKDRDSVLDKLDQIAGELAQIREDRIFETFEHKEFKEQLADHESRISKVEKN